MSEVGLVLVLTIDTIYFHNIYHLPEAHCFKYTVSLDRFDPDPTPLA
jgi:hypothetical protein